MALFFLLAALAFADSCAKYHPMPLARVPDAQRLEDLPAGVVRARAAEIQHPILQPLTLNEQDGLSPEEAAVMAVVANPTLLAIRDQRKLAAAQIIQAGILPNPQLSANLMLPATAGAAAGSGFGLGWNLKALLQRNAKIESAERNAASVDLNVAWQEWQVAQDAKMRVYRLVYLQRQLRLAQAAVGGFQSSVDLVRKALAAGYTTIVEMSSARAALLRAKSQLLSVQQEITLEQQALKRALGVGPERTVRLQDGVQPPDLAKLPTLAQLVSDLETHRLDLLAFRLGYQSQEARVRAAVRGRFPQINLSVNEATDTSSVTTLSPAIDIGLPFFDRNQGMIANERASRQQLFDQYTSRLFTARADVARILNQAQVLRDRVQVGQQGIISLTDLVETYRQALLQGNADILVYYNARNELMNTQLSVLRLRQNLADLSIGLELAAGEPLSSMTSGGT